MSSKPRNFRQTLSNWFTRVFAPERTSKVEELENLVRLLTPREREAIEYQRHIRRKALEAYTERVRIEKRTPHPLLGELETATESFIRFLDSYGQLKRYLGSANRQYVETEIEKEKASLTKDPEHDPSYLASMQKRLRVLDEVQRKVLLIEAQLKMIENFFELIQVQSAVMRSGSGLKTFEQLLENDLQSVLTQISITKDRLQAEVTSANQDSLRLNNQTLTRNQNEMRSSTAEVIRGSQPNQPNEQYDLFLSHAFEDKETIARPLYRALVANGVTVWFDEAVLLMGDSLRRRIDAGLAKCRYGIVILSPKFLNKQWPQRELDALVARETATGEKAILPIWHELDRDTLMQYSPALIDRLAGRSEDGIDALVNEILRVVSK